MKKTKLIAALALAGVMAVGIGTGVGTVKSVSAAEGDLPTETVLTAETLNAGTTSSNPWKKTFDYWSNMGSTENNVTYTQQGVKVERANKTQANIMNFINAPTSIVNDDKFEITLNMPLYTAAGELVEGITLSDYPQNTKLSLYSGTGVFAYIQFWGNTYTANKANGFITATFAINGKTLGSVHVSNDIMEEGNGVKIAFDKTNGWSCDVVEDGTVVHKQITSADLQTGLSGVTATDVNRVQLQNADDGGRATTNNSILYVKNANGQNLCLDNENKLTVSNSFNVMQLQVKSGTQFRAKQTYSFELVGISDPTVAVASRNKTTTDPTVWTYANPNAAMMGNIGWDNGKIQLKLAKKDGTEVKNQIYSGTWGKTSDGVIEFTIPEAGEYTLSLIFYTSKGYSTVRTLDITAEAVPYITAENLAKDAYYAGDEITIPAAKLMNKEGTAEIEGKTITSAVTFGGNSVESTGGKFTAESAGKYTITYSAADVDGLTITATLDVTVKTDTVKSLEIATQPTKTEYYAGDTFDKTGMVVNAVYESGKKVAIDDYDVSTTQLTAGQTSIQVSYQTFKIPVTITVSAAPTIQVAAGLNKVYYVGQEVTVPSATLVDENKQEIAGAQVSSAVTCGETPVSVPGGKFTVAAAGTYKIAYSATHGGRTYTTEATFTAQEDTVTGIKVTAQPTKTSYTVGDKFDKTGMVVKAVYASLKEVEITDYTVTDTALALGDTEVTVSYLTFTAKVEIRVHALVHIDLKSTLEKTYYIGTEVTLPEAKLVDEANGGAEIAVAVTFGGEPVDSTGGKFTIEQAGKYTIVYTTEYDEETITESWDVTGIVDRVVEIKITTQPTKTSYTEGDTFDKTGMVVKAVYESGKEAEVSDFEYKLVAFTTKDDTVVISYGGKSASVAIEVEPIGGTTENPPVGPVTEPKKNNGLAIGLGVGAAVVVVAAVVVTVVMLKRKKGSKKED